MKDDSPFVWQSVGRVREIHTWMLVILPEKHHEAWLSGEAGKEILVPFPAEQRTAWPIGLRVNIPANNDPGILTPIEA
jgi:putative SOS response-associated peptidase YedK